MRILLRMKLFGNGVLIFALLSWVASVVFPADVRAITAQQEEKLSREFMRIVRQKYRIIDDPLIADYVTKVGRRIVSVLPQEPFTYHFYVVDEDVYNAFAAPAAHVFINRGLIEAMRSEDDLAGILAHEITHVHCRHISDMIDRSKKIGLVSMAGVLAGLLLGVGGSTELASAVSVGSAAAGQTMALAYTREDEMQADQLGLKYLSRAGYAGSGLLHMLKEIRSRQWFDSKSVPTYLMTHPAVEHRIAYIANWIDEQEKGARQAVKPAPIGDFAAMRTRLAGLYGDESLVLNQFKRILEDNPGDGSAHYGLGLVLARTGRYRDAAAHLRLALAQNAADPYMLRDLGKIYLQDGQYREALIVLRSAVVFLDEDTEAGIMIGRSLLGLGEFGEAESILQDIVRQHPHNSDALYYLGESCARQGRAGESHYYLGRYYAGRHEKENAVFHLSRSMDLLGPEDTVGSRAQELLESIKGGPQQGHEDSLRPSGGRSHDHGDAANFGQNAKTAW